MYLRFYIGQIYKKIMILKSIMFLNPELLKNKWTKENTGKTGKKKLK